MPEEKEISKIFSSVYRKYDLFNDLFSFGIARLWRKHAANVAIANINRKAQVRALDAATGTGDLAIALYNAAKRDRKQISIIGIDINKDMLKVAREKAKKKIKQHSKGITFVKGNALKTGFRDKSFDIVVSAFALRNLSSLNAFFAETARILKPSGVLVVEDMSVPSGFFKYFFAFYKYIIYFIGSFVDRNAYGWLVESINMFNTQHAVETTKRYFSSVKFSRLATGMAFIIVAKKPKPKFKHNL